MIDIYFINTVINIIWYIFSILFVLYKFTSFFSYIYNFGKFLGRLTQGICYVKDRVVEFTEQRQNQYITRPIVTQSIFTRMKNKITSYFWGEPKDELILPMYTRVSDLSFDPPKNKKKDLDFENCINKLMTESKPNKNSFVSIDLSNSQNRYDSNYESYYDTSCSTSELFKSKSCESCGSKSEYFIKKDIISEPQIIENESENVKQKFNIQDSDMLFNSNFIKNTFNTPS